MDCCGSYKTTPIFEALPSVVKTQRRGVEVSLAKFGFSNSSRKSILPSQNILKVFGIPESGRHIYTKRRIQPLFVAVASTEYSCFDYNDVGTPLKPSSPAGEFLSGILRNQRHLFHFAVSEQLDELASDRDGAIARNNSSSDSMESSLHRRIAEMKESECQIAVEDVMYMSIVHKFSEIKVPMVPKLSRCISNNRLEIWPSKCKELESIHSFEVQEMIKEHLATILHRAGKSCAMDKSTTTRIDRIHLGRIYAASIMYGYFLKSASLRHQLELNLACSSEDRQPLGHGINLPAAELNPFGFKNLLTLGQWTDSRVASLCQEPRRCDMNLGELSSYVMGFDSDTLQRCAKVKSKEAVNLIEKHTWALFGDDQISEVDGDNNIIVTFPSVERLVLEALAFGSFLWDVERSVDSVYRFDN